MTFLRFYELAVLSYSFMDANAGYCKKNGLKIGDIVLVEQGAGLSPAPFVCWEEKDAKFFFYPLSCLN